MAYILLNILVLYVFYSQSFNNGFRSSYNCRKSGLISLRTKGLQIQMKSSLFGSSSAKNIEQIRGPKTTIVRSIKKVFGSLFKFIQLVISKILAAPKFVIKSFKGGSISSSYSSSSPSSTTNPSAEIAPPPTKVSVTMEIDENAGRIVPVSKVKKTPHEIREIERAKRIVESKLKEIEESIETAKVLPVTTKLLKTATVVSDVDVKEINEGEEVIRSLGTPTGMNDVDATLPEVAKAQDAVSKVYESVLTSESKSESVSVKSPPPLPPPTTTTTTTSIMAEPKSQPESETRTPQITTVASTTILPDALPEVPLEEVSELVPEAAAVVEMKNDNEDKKAGTTIPTPTKPTTVPVMNEGGILDSLEFGPVNPFSVVGSGSSSSSSGSSEDHSNTLTGFLSGVAGSDKYEEEKEGAGASGGGGGSISMEKVKAAGVSGIISYVGTEVVFWAFSLPLVISAYHSSTGEWLSISNALDRGRILALSATFITAIRLAVPLRLGVAVALTPWVENNITKRYLIASDDNDNQKFTINFNAILEDLKYSSETASQYLKEHVRESNNISGSNDVNDDTTISHINMDENAEVQAESKEVESVGVRGSVEL